MVSQVYMKLLLTLAIGVITIGLGLLMHNLQEGFSNGYEPLEYSCQNQQECLRKLVKFYENDHRRKCIDPRYCPGGYYQQSNPCSFNF